MTASSAAFAGLPVRRWILDLGASALLVIAALVGFWPTFAGPSFLPAVVGGVVLGLAIAAVTTWRRWGILIIAGLTVAAYFLFGGAFALPQTSILGFTPTSRALSSKNEYWRMDGDTPARPPAPVVPGAHEVPAGATSFE